MVKLEKKLLDTVIYSENIRKVSQHCCLSAGILARIFNQNYQYCYVMENDDAVLMYKPSVKWIDDETWNVKIFIPNLALSLKILKICNDDSLPLYMRTYKSSYQVRKHIVIKEYSANAVSIDLDDQFTILFETDSSEEANEFIWNEFRKQVDILNGSYEHSWRQGRKLTLGDVWEDVTTDAVNKLDYKIVDRVKNLVCSLIKYFSKDCICNFYVALNKESIRILIKDPIISYTEKDKGDQNVKCSETHLIEFPNYYGQYEIISVVGKDLIELAEPRNIPNDAASFLLNKFLGKSISFELVYFPMTNKYV